MGFCQPRLYYVTWFSHWITNTWQTKLREGRAYVGSGLPECHPLCQGRHGRVHGGRGVLTCWYARKKRKLGLEEGWAIIYEATDRDPLCLARSYLLQVPQPPQTAPTTEFQHTGLWDECVTFTIRHTVVYQRLFLTLLTPLSVLFTHTPCPSQKLVTTYDYN